MSERAFPASDSGSGLAPAAAVIPAEIVDAIAAGRAVLVVGSRVVGPGWERLIALLTEQLATDGASNGTAGRLAAQAAAAAQRPGRGLALLGQVLGEDLCNRMAADVWQVPEVPHDQGSLSAAARALARVPVGQVWTTIPGDVIESALNAAQPPDWPAPRVVTPETAGTIQPRQRIVLALFGDPGSYAVTPRAVRHSLARADELLGHVRRAYLEATLILVGFEPGDPDLGALLDLVLRRFDVPVRKHYLVAPASGAHGGAGLDPASHALWAAELAAEHNIELVDQSRWQNRGQDRGQARGQAGNQAGNQADSLASFLAALAAACAAAGVTLAQHQPDDDDLDGWLALLDDRELGERAAAAVARMEQAARTSGNTARLVDVLVARAERADTGVERAALLRTLAEVLDELANDPARALAALSEAARAHPAETSTLDEIERLARELDGFAEVIGELSEVASSIEDRGLAARYWNRIARWYHAELDHPDYALVAVRQALDCDPGNLEAHAALAELYRKQQRWADLAGALRALVDVELDPDKQTDLYLALGDLYENRLASTAQAIEAYQLAADLERDNDDALAALERLLRKSDHWDRLADVLDRRAALIEHDSGHDPGHGAGPGAAPDRTARAAALRREAAILRADRLGDLDGAIARCEAVLAATETSGTGGAGNVAALSALDELYERAGRTDDHARVLARLVALVPEAEQPRLLRRLGAAVAARDPRRAVDCYERLLAVEPGAEDAFQALARLYRLPELAQGTAEERAAVYERQLAILGPSPGPALALARLYETELGDVPRAIELYQTVRTLPPDRRDHDEERTALAALARLYRQTEAWERAVDALVALAEAHAGSAGNSRISADAWAEAGALVLEHLPDLLDPSGRPLAEVFLDRALQLEPGHGRALASLARVHEAHASWASAVELLTRAAAGWPEPGERLTLLARAARLAEERLADAPLALGLWLEIAAAQPGHTEAGSRAAEHLMAAGRWQEAVSVLTLLVLHSPENSPERHGLHQVQLGRAYLALGEHEQAARHFRQALEADPEAPGAALGLADALCIPLEAHVRVRVPEAQAGQAAQETGPAVSVDEHAAAWREIEARYRQILVKSGSELARERLAEIWYRVGLAAAGQGATDRAVEAWRRALDSAPRHLPSLVALAEQAEAQGDWHTVIECKRAQLAASAATDTAASGTAAASAEDEQVRLLQDIAAMYRDKLASPVRALDAYQEALALRPTSPVLLHRILDIHTEQKQWRRAIDVLETLAASESSAARRARYHHAAGVIARAELDDAELAIEQFRRVLDDEADPRSLEALDELLGDRGDYRTLARVYRNALRRMGDQAEPALLARTWTRLGDICLDYLDDREAAVAAFEVAVSLTPDDMACHEQLANLYLDSGPERRDEAAAELQVLLAASPERIELYRALSDVYSQAGAADKAYCLAQALVFLGAATEAETALFQRHRTTELVVARRRLTDELWRKAIVHPREDRALDAIFAALSGALASLTAQPPSAFGLREPGPDRGDRGERSQATAARVFRYASEILALADLAPQLHLMPGERGIRVANTRDGSRLVPSVLIGNPHLDQHDERSLAFELGKRLAYLRPERFVHHAMQTLPRLEAAFRAALTVAGVSGPGPAAGAALVPASTDQDAVAELAAHLRTTVPEAVLEQVRAVASTLASRLNSGSDSASSLMAGWRTAADLTANRVGLILCGDLETAARLVATESADVSTLSTRERLLDLLAYSVSEPYFAVRRHLGIEIQPA